MKGKICVVIAIALLVLSLFNASVVMAQTLKYAPAPQELPHGFYYTQIVSNLSLLEKEIPIQCEVKPIYGEAVVFRSKAEEPVDGSIFIVEFLNVEDAKKCYLCYMAGLFSGLDITEINAFGDESIGGWDSYKDLGYDEYLMVLRNDRFIAFMVADPTSTDHPYESLTTSKIVVTQILPKIIDEKLEQVKAPTPTPTPSIPAFQIITAIATLLAVAYLLRRRK
ncbi:MAG: hypothetical protein WA977_04385 [Halobacteriota archaeon]